jgi:hypothetical protein
MRQFVPQGLRISNFENWHISVDEIVCAYRKSDLQPGAGTQSFRPDEANGQGT